MKKKTAKIATNSINKLSETLIMQGYSSSFVVGACEAAATGDDKPWLFPEKLAVFKKFGIDLDEFCKGFNFMKMMEGLKNV